MGCMVAGQTILMKILADEAKSVAGFEFCVPRYQTTLRFPLTANMKCLHLLYQFRRSRIFRTA